MGKLFLFLTLFLVPLFANADVSCYESELVIDKEEMWNFTKPISTGFLLPSHGQYRDFTTRAAAWFKSEHALDLLVQFDFFTPKEESLSLPYNIYRVDLTFRGGSEPEKISLDFTDNCQGTGYSIYPGGLIRLPVIKIPPHKDGRTRFVEPVRIQIWGHL